jgi:hypothetical protein
MGDSGYVRHQEQLEKSFDSGDPDGFVATAKWLFQQYPAERYGLVLWSHGTGWEPAEIEEVAKEARPEAETDPAESKERASAPGSRALFHSTLRMILKPDKPSERAILFDDGTGHSHDTLELARVVDSIVKTVGQPIDLLGMDACLMATLEVGYQLRNSVCYIVASEELVPGHSWPYGNIFGKLRDRPDSTPAELAALVVKEYTDYYTANPPSAGDVTNVALDLRQIEKLSVPVSDLASALIADMDSQADLLWKVQVETERKESRDARRQPNKFNFHLWDMQNESCKIPAQNKKKSAPLSQEFRYYRHGLLRMADPKNMPSTVNLAYLCTCNCPGYPEAIWRRS